MPNTQPQSVLQQVNTKALDLTPSLVLEVIVTHLNDFLGHLLFFTEFYLEVIERFI